MNCKYISFCFLLMELCLFKSSHNALNLNSSLCSKSTNLHTCLHSWKQDGNQQSSVKKNHRVGLNYGDNSGKRKTLSGAAPSTKNYPEKRHNRIRKNKLDRRKEPAERFRKHTWRRKRKRRHKRQRFHDFTAKRQLNSKDFFRNSYNSLKREFEFPYNKNKNSIYNDRNSDRIFFPVTKFGNFSNNEVDSSWELKRSPYRKSRRGSRWRHLNPHSEKVAKLIVRIHNVLRGRVSPPAKNMLAMSWNDVASEQAQRWADDCKPSATPDHPSVRWTPLYGTCGQNVHVAFKKKRWGRVVRHWWNERRYFRYGHSNNYTKVHQYTQMAWYNSHKVGCGFSQCSNRLGKTFYRYVCNYCPGGNDPRRISKPYSRGRQCESCPNSCRAVCKGGRCKLCTNSCPFSDLWANCESLSRHWKEWLCNTKTSEGIDRFKNCRATCQCQNKIT